MTEPRIVFKRASVIDAEGMLAVMEPEKTRNLSFFTSPPSLERQRAFLKRVVESESDRLYLILEKATGRIIGTVGLHEHDKANHNARLGILIFAERDRRSGFGNEATAFMLVDGFVGLDLHKIYVRILARNEAARAHYRKLGFQEEGIMREEYLLDGIYHDMVLFSMLQREWEAAQ